MKLLAIFRFKADSRFDAFLPATVKKQSLLRRKGEIAFFPLAVFQDAKIFEKLADIFGFRTRNGDVVRRPGIRGDFIFAPTGVAARLGVHLQKDEVGKAAFAKSPSGAQAGDSAANNDDRNFFDALRRGKACSITQEMAHLEGIVNEGALDLFFTFEGQADESRAAETEKLASAQLQ